MELYDAPRHRRAVRVRRLGAFQPLAAVVVFIAFVWLLLGAPGLAQAQPVPVPPGVSYDARLAAQREVMLRIMYNVSVCMRQGTVAMLRNGQRDRAVITDANISLCGGYLKSFLADEVGYTPAQVSYILKGMSDYRVNQAFAMGAP